MQGPRAQVSRTLYKKAMQETLRAYPNLTIKAGSVADLVLEHHDHPVASTSNSTDVPLRGQVRGIRTGECTYLIPVEHTMPRKALMANLLWNGQQRLASLYRAPKSSSPPALFSVGRSTLGWSKRRSAESSMSVPRHTHGARPG